MTLQDFLTKRYEGALSVAEKAKQQGTSISKLTAIHFEAKLPVYKTVQELSSNDAMAVHKLVYSRWSEAADKLKNQWSRGIYEFQRVTGELEAYGEIAQFLENPHLLEKKKNPDYAPPEPPSTLNPLTTHSYYMAMSDYHNKHASKHSRLRDLQKLWSGSRGHHDDMHNYHKALRDGYAQKALAVNLESSEQSPSSRMRESFTGEAASVADMYNLHNNPPKGVHVDTWQKVVLSGMHTTYGGARAHYNRYVKKHGAPAGETGYSGAGVKGSSGTAGPRNYHQEAFAGISPTGVANPPSKPASPKVLNPKPFSRNHPGASTTVQRVKKAVEAVSCGADAKQILVQLFGRYE